MNDISSRADIDALLRRFYAAACEDRLIGPYFTEIAGVDLEAHLPHIGDFWEGALLRTASYRRNALAPHQRLHKARPLAVEHFGRWLQLWRAAVDGRYAGPIAERAKTQGERVALAMPNRLDVDGTAGSGVTESVTDAGSGIGPGPGAGLGPGAGPGPGVGLGPGADSCVGFVPLAAVELRLRAGPRPPEAESPEP